MEPSSGIDAAIDQLLPDALEEFGILTASLSGLQGSDRLVLLNRLVLAGPAYSVLGSKLNHLAVPESTDLIREITTLQAVPESYLKDSVGGFIDIELQNFVSPKVEIHPLPSDKVIAFLQASTDARLVPFGRLISYLSSTPAFNDEIIRTPILERAVTFAVHVMTTKAIRFIWWLRFSERLQDPIARVIFLNALKTAVIKALISPETASTCLGSINRAT